MIREPWAHPIDTPADPSYVGHMPTEHLSTAQVAAQLGVDVRTVHRMVAAGRLEPVYKGTGVRGAYVFTAEAVDGLREKAAS